MSEDPSNGAQQAQQPTQEQLEDAAVAQLSKYIPAGTKREDVLRLLSLAMKQELVDLVPFMEQNSAKWGIELNSKFGPAPILGPVVVGDAKNQNELICSLSVLAFATSPMVRAVMMLNNIPFKFVRLEDKKSALILV